MKKKMIGIFLTAAVLLSLFPAAPVLAAGEEVVYTRQYLTYPLLNSSMSSASDLFLDQNGNSVFNMIGRFAKLPWSSQPDVLSFDTSTSGGSYWVYYNFNFDPVERSIAEKGDMAVAYSADLTNDKHINLLHHWDKRLSYAATTLSSANYAYQSWGKKLHEYNSQNYDQTITLPMTDGYKFEPVGTGAHECEGLHLYNQGLGCVDGTSSISHMAVMLADTQGPAVQSVYTTKLAAPDSPVFTQFHAGDTFYIQLKFDEPIRFASDSVTDAVRSMKLNVSLKRITDNTSFTGDSAEAGLVSLIGDTLTFAYTVPETMGSGVTTNFYLDKVDYANQGTWINSAGDGVYDLSYVYRPSGGAVTTLPFSDKEKESKLDKVSSLVVDLAGNAVNQAKSCTFFSRDCYMDNVAPTVKKISTFHALKNSNNVTALGSTFMTAGDKIGFWAYFDEEMLLNIGGTYTTINASNVGNIKAELNLSGSSGTIVADASKIESVDDGVNGPRVSQIYFEFTVPDTAEPIKYADGVSRPAGINRIYSADANLILSDTRGNAYGTVSLIDTADADRVMPAEQLWLDTVQPELTTSMEPDESSDKYTPIGTATDFYFPVSIADVTGAYGSAYVSGTTGATGSFRWANNETGAEAFNFEYCVGGVTVPDTAYKPAKTGELITLPEVDGGDVIHIRLLSDTDYSLEDTSLVVTPVDNAGNVREYTFPLNYVYDNIGPVITKGAYSTAYDGAAETGSITAEIDIRDILQEASTVECRWVCDGDDSSSWADITASNTSADSLYKVFTSVCGDLAAGAIHQCTLQVRTLDGTGTVQAETSFSYDYDLSKPKYTLKFNTDPKELQAKHSVAFTAGYETATGTGTVHSTAIAMVKIDGTENEYWVKSNYMPLAPTSRYAFYPTRPSASPDIFAIPSNYDLESKVPYIGSYLPYFMDWFRCTVTRDTNNNMTITRLVDLTDQTNGTNTENHRALSDLFNSYYGYLDLTLIAANEEEITLNTDADTAAITIPGSVICERLHYALKSAAHQAQKMYDITVTPTADDGTPETNDNLVIGFNKSYSLDGLLAGAPQVLRSFDGAALKVDIRSNTLLPDYVMSDIGEAILDVYHIWYDETGLQWTTQVFETSLAAVSSQTVQIPAGAIQESGEYSITISIQCKADMNNRGGETFYGFYVDKQTIDTYGVSKVTGSMAFNETSVPLERDYGLSPGTRTPEVFLGTAGDTNVTFRADYVQQNLYYLSAPGTDAVTDKTRAYLRVWNESTGDSTGWLETDFVGTGTPYYDYHNGAASYLDGYFETALSSADLIALAGDGDTLCYQFMTSSADKSVTVGESGSVTMTSTPYTTPVQTLVLRTSGDTPSLEMAFDPSQATNGDVTASVWNLQSNNSAPEALTLWYAKKGDAPAAFTMDQALTISENGTYFFAVCDKYLNCSIVPQLIDWIDKTVPSLSVTDNSSGNGFSFAATITDDNPAGLYVSLDGGAVYPVPEAVGGGTWTAGAESRSGIYRSETASAAGMKTVSFSGVFPYDASAPATVDHVVTLYAMDEAGNKSAEWSPSASITAANTSPACTSVACGAGGVTAAFNAPVIIREPSLNATDSEFGPEKALPIYANGTYTIKYADIFGNNYEQTITVSGYQDLSDIKVGISETDPTNRDVVIVLDASGNADAELMLPAADSTMTVDPVTANGAVKGATITVKENRSVSFSIMSIGGTAAAVSRTINVSNIDRTAPTASVAWAYAESVNEQGQTKGEVIASLIADEAVSGTGGTTTRHVFTLDDQADYTFEYCDAAGNAGTPVTASLSRLIPPVTIVEKTVQDADTAPPDYSMAVYRNVSGSLVRVDRYTKADYDPSSNPFAGALYRSSAMKLEFSVTDLNQTKLLLLSGLKSETDDLSGAGYSGAGETITGVSVSGNSVYITENAAFTVVIVDAKDNRTLVPVTITQIDKTAPTGTITYVQTGFYTIRAYIATSDDPPSDITMLSAVGALWDPAYNSSAGAWYHEFTANGSFTFTFEDAAGNVGTATATVGALDDAAPAVTEILWSPCLIDGDGKADESRPTASLTNKCVTAYLTFSRNIKSASAVLIDSDGNAVLGITPSDYYDLSTGTSTATVRFRQGARLRLLFTAVNGRSGTQVLEVGSGVIDMTAPAIQVISSEPASGAVKSVGLTFVSDEPAYYLNNGDAFTDNGSGGYEYGVTVSENGTYTYSFVDRAGNIANKSVTLTRIDSTAPVVALSGLPKTKAETGHTSQTGNVGFSVSIDEAGTLTFGAQTVTVAAGQQQSFSVGANGRYSITAADEVGNKTYKSFVVDCIDTVKPVILFDRSVLKVGQETSLQSFETAAAEGVSVSDNYDEDMTGRWGLSRTLTQDQLDTPGTYTVTYAATDSAGNVRTVTRSVQVYSKNEPTVFINGEKSDSRETLFFSTDQIELSISLPNNTGGTEPYKLYYSGGLLTAGQIKTCGIPLAVSGDQASFTAVDNGYYTIYLVTQSRQTYITYIYVQQ